MSIYIYIYSLCSITIMIVATSISTTINSVILISISRGRAATTGRRWRRCRPLEVPYVGTSHVVVVVDVTP